MALNITTEFWDFIEANVSDYNTREDVLRQSELQLFIDGHESIIAGITREEAIILRDRILYQLYYEAIDAFTRRTKINQPHCDDSIEGDQEHISECRPIGNIDGKEQYVLVKFPEDTYKIEEEEIGYPCSNAEDIQARYIPESDYTRIFGKTPEPNSFYRPVRWPESQKYMPDEEGNGDPAGNSVQALCELINDEKGLTDFGEGAYWVPLCMLR